MHLSSRFFSLFAAFAFAGLSIAEAASFTPGNLVILRVGDGVGTLSSAAAPVFLDEYTTTGTLVQSLPLPTAVSGANARLTLSGSATSEGALQRSVNGAHLTLAGYDAASGTASVVGTTSSATNRVIALVDADGSIDTSTRLGDGFSANNVRSAITLDGQAF